MSFILPIKISNYGKKKQEKQSMKQKKSKKEKVLNHNFIVCNFGANLLSKFVIKYCKMNWYLDLINSKFELDCMLCKIL